jgi:uncharacterized protein (TIGR00730 family)
MTYINEDEELAWENAGIWVTPSELDLEEAGGSIEPLEPASRRARGPVSRRIYTTGSPVLDKEINDILVRLADHLPGLERAIAPADLDLTRELITSAIRLVGQGAGRDELKMVNAALKEFAYSFRVFKPYKDLRKVSIFGSARIEPGEESYIAARDFAHLIAEHGWMVITGAGPGIMAAGHEGAGADHSFGANIRLPALNPANAYIARDGKLINFKYFFTRKVTFLKESDAFVLLPGGWGTLDETFELLTLLQTGKSDPNPVVLLEAEGIEFWDEWLDFVKRAVADQDFILPSDLSLFRIAHTPEEAAEEIERFYHNYQSARFIGNRLVLRIKRAPGAAVVSRLNTEFADLLTEGAFEVIDPTSPEVRDQDALDLQRLAFYPQHAYGRIRELIDVLNEL